MGGGIQTAAAENLSLLACLLKDLGWVLLLFPLAVPGMFVAFLAELWMLARDWPRASAGVRAHRVASLFWLVGNCIWLTVEFLYEQKEASRVSYPWYIGPYLGADMAKYDAGSQIGLFLFSAGLTVLCLYYAMAAYNRTLGEGSPKVRERPVFGCLSMGLYTALFIGPWMCKDVFWVLEEAIPNIIFGFITLAMVTDYIRRTQDFRYFADAFWVLGNVIWAAGEMAVPDQYEMPFRHVAAICLLAGIFTLISISGVQLLRGGGLCHEAISKDEIKPIIASSPGVVAK